MTWCYRLAALAVAVALAGCASDDSGGAGGSGSGAGGEGASDGAVVTFSETSPLSVAPGQEVHLSARAEPAGQTVSFLLIGDSLDASLDRAASPADGRGDAAVTLFAPSKAASFSVRASVGDPTGLDTSAPHTFADLRIEVSELGIGSLRIIPSYQGNRKIELWRAAVVAQARCKDFAPPGEPDDADVVEAPFGDDLVFDDAIVGPSLAVLVRSENKVWGCAETALAHAGETKEIVVPVLDRPVDLSTAALDLALILSSVPPELEEVFQSADDELLEAAFPEGDPSASVLLDAIRPRLPDEVRPLFDEARDGADLDAALENSFDVDQIEPRLLFQELLHAGRPIGPTFLTGRMSSAEADATHALLRVDSFAGVDGELAGVPTEHLLSFVANPGDTVVIGAESGILFFPTRLVGALAQQAALAQEPTGTAFSTTLAEAVGCDEVAYVIGPLGDCDSACVEAACRHGLGDVWNRSLDASANDSDLGVFTLVLSGQGVVDGNAALVALGPVAANSWVGELQAVSRSANLGGTAFALEADDEAAGGGSSSTTSGAGGGAPVGEGGGDGQGGGEGQPGGDGGDGQGGGGAD